MGIGESMEGVTPDPNQRLAGDSAAVRMLARAGLSGSVLTHRNPLRHALWVAVRCFNARWQLRQCNRVGPWTRADGRIFVENRGTILLGSRVYLHSTYARIVLSAHPGGTIEIGDRTFLNYGVDICATRLVQIGADCLIGTHVMILDNNFHDLIERNRRPEGRPVIIGTNVWLGSRSIILPGCTIGEGAVVGAGSVVTSSVAPWTVVAGNPARVIRELKPPDGEPAAL
jgi:acetyltransferase-like isoleucine patch superfamily enzyme